MIKKFLVLLLFLFSGAAQSAQIVNVEYVHNAIKQKWDITIPYNSELTNPRVAANMKYLLTAVDVANEMLNGTKIAMYGQATGFGDSEYATTVAADTIATNTAVDTLIEKIEYKFFIKTADITKFSFKISASGTFFIDWGDEKIQVIKKNDIKDTTYSHTYDASGTYDIRIGGKATGYSSTFNVAAISFRDNLNITSIDGSIGDIFSTLSDGTRPGFPFTFYGCKNIKGQIPENLFRGVTGAPKYWMFNSTFYNCSGLTGTIPKNLFADLNGKPAGYMFYLTFSGCSGLTGEIPAELFSGIQGPPATIMFGHTFAGCSKLTGMIPENLFGGISGTIKNGIFLNTFSGCKNLTGIPENLFGNIYGDAQSQMFSNTFSGCSGLTGQSARINGEYLYNIWPDATDAQVGKMYNGATGLSDYDSIPSIWK